MTTHEGRLRAMLGPESKIGWNLNDEDRAAIRWILDLVVQKSDEAAEARAEFVRELRRTADMRDNLQLAIRAMTDALARS